MHILITGGSGFIGQHLIPFLLSNGHSVTAWVHKHYPTTPNIHCIRSLSELSTSENIDCIINLAGASIAKRWSPAYKQKLIDSRIHTTQAIIEFIDPLKTKPKCLISASAIGYYGSQGSMPLTEDSGYHDEFTHQLCQQWENAALQAEKLGLRVCLARLGVVLGKGGGALKQMLPPFKMGLGGKIGPGTQYMSWVHVNDVIKAFYYFMHSNASGIYNLTAPNPVTNQIFAQQLAKALRRPAIFPIPAIMVKLLFGEMGEALLLAGQNVIPDKLQKEGFGFDYPTVEQALCQILS